MIWSRQSEHMKSSEVSPQIHEPESPHCPATRSTLSPEWPPGRAKTTFLAPVRWEPGGRGVSVPPRLRAQERA